MILFLYYVTQVYSRSVFHLDDTTFDQVITNGNKKIPWFILFGSENCPACVQAYPEFELASEQARGFVRFGYADTRFNPKISSKLGVYAIPAFFFFTEKETKRYEGQRLMSSFLSFISEEIGDGIEEADESWADQTDRRVILFTRRFKSPAIFSAVFSAFKHEGIVFGLTRDSDTIEAFDNPPVPSLWFMKDGEKTQYKGEFDYFSLTDAISKHFGLDSNDSDL